MSDFGTENLLAPDPARHPIDARRHPRFKLDVEIKVRSRGKAPLRGYTVDISESGVSAMLRLEVGLGAVVQLDFELPLGKVSALAVVRQKRAFRYGFQFVDPDSIRDLIRRTCDGLSSSS